jgi:hypothetical protein
MAYSKTKSERNGDKAKTTLYFKVFNYIKSKNTMKNTSWIVSGTADARGILIASVCMQ